MTLVYQDFKSPIGVLYLVANESHLTAVVMKTNWPAFKSRQPNLSKGTNKILARTYTQLERYFKGEKVKFDMPLELSGTPFQRKAWQGLCKIPYGKTSTYKQQALMIKNPKAVRAVGSANGANPLCIIVPCHRVIGSDGSLAGYSGGVSAKRFLLRLEGVDVA